MQIQYEEGSTPRDSMPALVVNEIRYAIFGSRNSGGARLVIKGAVEPTNDSWTIKVIRADGTEVSRKIYSSDLTFVHPDVQQALREIRLELEKENP